MFIYELAQLTFTCSKSAIETLEKSVKYFQRLDDAIGVVLVFLLLTLKIFHTFSYCFYHYFEQENVSWEVTVDSNTIPVS